MNTLPTFSAPNHRPELLAPAGDWDCARAAIENGADAIYFGLEAGFNARARATNFSLDKLPDLMALLHRRGVKGYVTLNTLVFTDELPALETHIRAIAAAGVDAVLVQDIGAARLIREICPSLALHASTQMTMTCAETIAAIEELGIERVVLARELSLKEIARIHAATSVELETFVHGALCVAYSGQCLTSESLGGRSANRGQCAQACRLNYELVVDGEDRPLGDVQYLLSPQDLAAYELIPELIAAGVKSLKIEGRLKTAEYVANITGHYRRAIDAACAGERPEMSATDRREMELSFSRGFSPGWLAGANHPALVPGKSSSKRGVQVGKVIALYGERLEVELILPLAKGDGIVLDGNRAKGEELGGRIYQIFRGRQELDQPAAGRVQLAMQHGLLANAVVWPGQAVWQTDDPQLSKRLRSSYESADPVRRLPIDIAVRAIVGEPFTLTVRCADGVTASITSDYSPVPATKHPATEELLRTQLGRLGGSAYELRTLTAKLAGEPMIPLSVLGALRKELIAKLDEVRTTPAQRSLAEPNALGRMGYPLRGNPSAPATHWDDGHDDDGLPRSGQPLLQPALTVLVRSLAQLDSVLAAGVKQIYAEFHDLRQYRAAVEQTHAAGATIHLATLRIHKPGENELFVALAKNGADGWLVRNLAAADYARAHGIPMIGDFSLNVTNPLTADWLLARGFERITASYDLNRDQLLELVADCPPQFVATGLEVVVHQHMPMFHMEHCVFCAVMSPGKNKTDCGRPCDRHAVELRDRVGAEHVLHADIGCRNTLYNSQAQSGAEAVAPLIAKGVRHFRIELLNDAPAAEVTKLISLYQQLLAGQITGHEVWRELKAANRVGVTRGPLEQARNPLAVL